MKEYQVNRCEPTEVIEDLNRMAADGWTFDCATTIYIPPTKFSGENTLFFHYYYRDKRE